jgi:uncharacterized protein (TIGR02996 family)
MWYCTRREGQLVEEEAFIRAIVEADGDDLHRLVYADWLEERGDGRADYLRAEMKWALPWRAGERPRVPADLEAMARRLDPLWVARVSRPPLGVCCEHLRWYGGGRQLTPADIAAAEREMRLNLPPVYVAFLLNHNGGHAGAVGPWRERVYGRRPVTPEDTDWYYAISVAPDDRTFRESLQRAAEAYSEWVRLRIAEMSPVQPASFFWYQDFVPIFRTIDSNFLVLIGVRGRQRGDVLTIDVSSALLPPSIQRLTLGEYLSLIVPPVPFEVPPDDDSPT